MNKLEAIALFKAMKILLDNKNYDGLGEVLDAVLNEVGQDKKQAERREED